MSTSVSAVGTQPAAQPQPATQPAAQPTAATSSTNNTNTTVTAEEKKKKAAEEKKKKAEEKRKRREEAVAALAVAMVSSNSPAGDSLSFSDSLGSNTSSSDASATTESASRSSRRRSASSTDFSDTYTPSSDFLAGGTIAGFNVRGHVGMDNLVGKEINAMLNSAGNGVAATNLAEFQISHAEKLEKGSSPRNNPSLFSLDGLLGPTLAATVRPAFSSNGSGGGDRFVQHVVQFGRSARGNNGQNNAWFSNDGSNASDKPDRKS